MKAIKLTVAENIASFLLESDVKVITHVPGFGATEVWQALEQKGYKRPMSFNEEPAVGIAHAAAVAGVRSAVIIKTHGLAKAGNALLTALSCGVQAGCIILAFHDASAKSSDNIFHAEDYIRGLGYPLRKAEGQTFAHDIAAGYKESEHLQIPLIMLLDAEIVEHSSFERSPMPDFMPYNLPYKKNIPQHVVCPFYAQYQHALLTAKLKQKELPPKPELSLQQFEEKPFYPTVLSYSPIMEALRAVQTDFVAGDTTLSTLYAFAPFEQVDVVSYLGGGIALALGAKEAGCNRVWALTGDFGFLSAGMLGVIELLQRRLPINILIFCNGKAAATGGQEVPITAVQELLTGFKEHPFLRVHEVNIVQEPKSCLPLFKSIEYSEFANIVLLYC